MELIVETSLLDDVKLKDDITEAQETAEEAYTTATKAVSIAGNNDQYFWTAQTGTDTGVHITLVSQETFKANPRGANLLARNNGVAIRDGLLEVAVFNQGGTFYNAYVNNQWQQVAAYTPTYMQIGATVSGRYNIYIDASGTAANNGFFMRNGVTNLSKWTTGNIVFYDGTANAYELAKFSLTGMTLRNSSNQLIAEYGTSGAVVYGYTDNNTHAEIARIYSGSGKDASGGTTISAYYTFGYRYTYDGIGNYSMAEGYITTASGYCSHAEGSQTKATGTCSHAEGQHSEASKQGAHAEGYSKASGLWSHSEGYNAIASGDYSHAEGGGITPTIDAPSTASGTFSHAEGEETLASGRASHAEGEGTVASGYCSHAQNYYTQAVSNYQTVVGKYNAVDSSNTYGFIVGNGTMYNDLSNAFTVAWNGTTTSNATGYADGQAKVAVSISGTSKVWMGVGSGGNNHGVYSSVNDKWIIAADGNGVIHSLMMYDNTASGTVYNVQVNSSGLVKRASSSKRYKKDIQILCDDELNPEKLYDLPVSQFKYKKQEKGDARYNKLIPGFIAEDVAKVYPIAACFDGDKVEDWEIRHIVPPMLKLVQDQKRQIDKLMSRIAELEERIA